MTGDQLTGDRMIRPRVAGRPTFRLAALQWLVAWAVVFEATLARYETMTGWALGVALPFLLGALFRTSPVRFAGRHGARWASLVGALCLPLLVVLLRGLAPAERTALWPWPWIALAVLLLVDVSAVRRIGRLVFVEAVKLAQNRVFLAGLVGTAAVTLLAAWTWTPPEEDASGWTMVGGVLGAGQWAAEVFLLVLGATAIAGEATGGTLKMMLPHAYTRADWVRAKAAGLLLAALVFTLLAAGIAIGATAVGRGFGDVYLPPLFGEEPEVFQTAEVLGSYLSQAVIAGFVALVATALLGLLLSTIFDEVVAALSFAILLFFGLRFADVVLSLPLKVMHGIYAWYPGEMRDVLSQIGRAFSEAPWDPTFLPQTVHLALLTATAAILLAIAAFTNRDIHA